MKVILEHPWFDEIDVEALKKKELLAPIDIDAIPNVEKPDEDVISK